MIPIANARNPSIIINFPASTNFSGCSIGIILVIGVEVFAKTIIIAEAEKSITTTTRTIGIFVICDQVLSLNISLGRGSTVYAIDRIISTPAITVASAWSMLFSSNTKYVIIYLRGYNAFLNEDTGKNISIIRN